MNASTVSYLFLPFCLKKPNQLLSCSSNNLHNIYSLAIFETHLTLSDWHNGTWSMHCFFFFNGDSLYFAQQAGADTMKIATLISLLTEKKLNWERSICKCHGSKTYSYQFFIFLFWSAYMHHPDSTKRKVQGTKFYNIIIKLYMIYNYVQLCKYSFYNFFWSR